jgi:two-component system, sensor histidine kinase and response regulator
MNDYVYYLTFLKYYLLGCFNSFRGNNDSGKLMNSAFLKNWPEYLEYKALRSHVLMAWCGVFIFPSFVFLDFLVMGDQWQQFFLVRLIGAAVIAGMLIVHQRFPFHSVVIAHVSSQIVFIALMWMLSQVKTPQQFFIYALNSCTAFIASAIFLLWKPKHSIILGVATVISFVSLCFLFSVLSFTEIISYGTLLLFTIVLMTQLYINYHVKITYRDFKNQFQLNYVINELNQKNHEINLQNQEILDQKEKLQKMNDLKDRLFMIVSHDFRSPLQSLKGLMMLVDNSPSLTPENFKSITDGIRQHVNYTFDFLEGLLVWSKNQMRGFEVNWSSVNLLELVNESVTLLQETYRSKNITVTVDVSPNHVVKADLDMVRLIIRNLISNAIKFTNLSGEIRCFSSSDGETITLSVSDNGIGLTQEQQDLLFQFNSKGHRNGTQKERGTGLGLMLCKEFIEKNGGRIWVFSKVDEGSTFSFSLPEINQEVPADSLTSFKY